MELNVNNAECIKYVEDIGGWRVYNICTETQSFIPWGVGHWLMFLLLSSLIGLALWSLWKLISFTMES